ncbi:FAD-dependent oxidoreductase [Neoroseomonas oryzicola]|uniref:FAD-binding oxidoreductase n=1 Tax=Neoroseomonas oryzicola TaxID=535904 RepID=A0A9X9WE92_9PROT|nr:FAD-binding oxidoreductase [Neoroseomonas oryzicola]NKE17912.1 FAD-binding oxidoreductase [Neoroseomonas oryzicola]
MTGLLAPDFAATPYWWRAAPPPEAMPGTLPKASDVVVVGGGYAGLSATLTIARAGRSVCVLDANSPGWGASTRSVGMIGGRLRQGYAALAATLGDAGAIDLMCEARDAYAWFRGFVDAEGIDCAMRITGRLLCAWTPADLRRLGGLARFLSARIGIPAEMLDRAALRKELGSDLHHGAMLLPEDGGLHPAQLHRGLLDAVQRAGATVLAPAAVRRIGRDPDGFRLSTSIGEIAARDVLLATNAHTGTEFPWFRKRVIPVGSYMIATESLPRKLLDELIPKHRLVNDTRQLAYAFRRAPDQDRLLVGGRASALDHADPKRVVSGLHRIMRRLFPELADVRISHAWGGMVAFTFDRLPRIGTHDGIHYVLGCNGSGVVMNTYLGSKAGARLIGTPDGATRFARDDFPTHPLYTGSPWFMAPLTAWYDLRDRAARLAAR